MRCKRERKREIFSTSRIVRLKYPRSSYFRSYKDIMRERDRKKERERGRRLRQREHLSMLASPNARRNDKVKLVVGVSVGDGRFIR